MKMFVIAALITVAAAARLEHLERSYLPPDHSFGGSSGGFGAAGGQNYQAGASFNGATSNQYLPPDHGPSSNGAPQFAGSLQGFGAQNTHSHSQFGAPQGPSSFGSNFQSQFPQQSGVNRQYLAPRPGAFQEPPQQAFDEETGYHY